jgi:hypothetical protein
MIKPDVGLGYLKSKANNILASSNIFAFDIACRAIGNSIPFSISSAATFNGSEFIMSDAGVWMHFDTTSSGFNSNIVTTSGVVTISGVVSSLNDYYLIRCYYDGIKFGTIVNGVETYINCDNVTISGSNLNIVTNNLLNIDSFAFYKDTLPTQALYDLCLTKLNCAISGTALVNSNENSKILFAADNFYPKDYSYEGLFEPIGDIPILYTDNVFYTQYSIAGGEISLYSDSFYVSRLPFTEAEYNCFVCENDKTFLTYFSGIVVPPNRILAESFTNYDYVSDNFITTNSGLYIRNCSKVFNQISSAINVIEFSDIGWLDCLDIGVLFGVDSIPEYPNENCVVVTGSGVLHIGTTTFSGLSASSNNSMYFYIDNSYITVSGSDTGILCSGIVTPTYGYIHYFVKSGLTDFSYKNLITLDKVTPSNNYQIKFDLTTSTFDYSKAKPNGEDLRFYYTGEGAEELDYWIENWDTFGTSTVWVKITVSGTSDFYMYYGNLSASPASNGDNVFEFFDDFEGTSLNTNKWETYLTYGDYSISDSQINIWSTSNWTDVYITNKESEKVELPVVISAKVRSSDGSCGGLRVKLYDGTLSKTYSITRDVTCNWGACADGPNVEQTIYDASSSEELFNMGITTNGVWFVLTSKIREDNKIEGYVDDVLKGVSTKVIDSDGYCRVRFGTYGSCCEDYKHQYADWVFARKYALYEPEATVGSEIHYSDFAFVNNIYISTKQIEIDTLTNKCFNYLLPEYYNLDNNYLELFYNVGRNISSDGIILYEYDFYDVQSSFSSYYDTTVSGMFGVCDYNFLGIDDIFEAGFITERWRLVCDPYGVFSCNQPGYMLIDYAYCYNGYGGRLYDGDTSVSVHSAGYVLTTSTYYQLHFNNDDTLLVDTISVYVTSEFINPEDGFVISCDVKYYSTEWYMLLDNYVSPTLSGVSWPIRHDISVPLVRTDKIEIRANSDWDQVVPTEIRPACLYNHGGTSVCVSDETCVYVVLDDVLEIYSEYTLENMFSVSFSGINYYPLNIDFRFKDYAENECYIKTAWTSSSGCDMVLSSGIGQATTSLICVDGEIEYIFNVSRYLDIIDLSGYTTNCTGISVHSNYAFSSDDLGLELVFYNSPISSPQYAAGSGCLFGFSSDYYTIYFSSIAVGYKYTALDGTDNLSKAGVGFNTYPPSLFIDKISGQTINQSHMPCQELTASGYQLSSSVVDNNISISTENSSVGGIQQVSKYNRVSMFSDYIFMPTIFYRTYNIGEGQQYATFSAISGLVKTGDKVYFYPGSHTVSTDKQLTLIGIGNPSDIKLQINSASAGLTVMGCTTTKCNGTNVFNMYNCYILPWTSGFSTSPFILLYTTSNINFYNCDLYNYDHMSYNNSYALLNKCTVYRTTFTRSSGYNITVYNEGYSTRGHYGYGPEFNRASITSGLSNISSIKMSSFYYDSTYKHFPLNNQVAIGNDVCDQLIASTDAYSVYFYGDIKKLNSFSMYLFVQDLAGTIKVTNSSDFVFTIDSNNLNYGIRLTMSVYGAEVDMVVPISHSNVFKLSIVSVVFDGGSISIYLNGAKLATKYIIVTSILFFDDTVFTCDGSGLLLKGASLQENIHFLIGTHVEEMYSNSSITITVNMELSTDSVLADYHNIGTISYHGYSCRNTGAGVYFDYTIYDYKHIYFNAEKSYKIYKNMAKKYIGVYKIVENNSCVSKEDTTYVSPQKTDSVILTAAKIDGKELGYCGIPEAYGYVNLQLQLPLPVINRTSFCFDTTLSVVMLSFDQASNPYCRDVGPNSLSVSWDDGSYPYTYRRDGIFHYCSEVRGNDNFTVYNHSVLNLTSNFTMEFLFTHFDNNGFSGHLLTKGTTAYNIAYRVGINSRHIPYFIWSWEGDNIVYAKKPIEINKVTYLAVVVGTSSISFYINGIFAGTRHVNNLTIVNNQQNLRIVYGYSGDYNAPKQIAIEELCILSKVKTANEITTTWEKISGGEKALWIKINNVVVVSDKPIKVSPSDRFIEEDGLIDISKWEYTAYRELDSSNGLILDSRTAKKLKSKVVSYNVIFDVSVFCEFLEYSVNRNWSVTFKYKFVSGNYIAVIIDYVKYDDIYVKCEYYYNGYKNETSRIKLVLSPCGIRFVTNYDKYTYVQIGDRSYWYSLWTSTQNLFLETSGRLEVTLSNDDWDSWFIVKITDFLPGLYCGSIVNGATLDFYDAVPYGRAFYNQIPENVAVLCLSNDVFGIDANSSCIHSLEFINGQLPDLHVLNTINRIFDNVNYGVFNIELLVYLTYNDTNILDLFPWINIDVKDKYLYVTIHDNDKTIIDSINESLNDYIYVAVSIGNPHTTLHINDQEFIYDTNFSDILPYHFYPIGKSFSGRVVYFCGYYGSFDISGYNFRVSTLARYIGFDTCARKIFGDNMVTSLDPYSIIYAYDNSSYSSMLASKSCSLGHGSNINIDILFDPAVLQSVVSSFVVIRCKYSSLAGKKITSITISAIKYNVSHNYYGSFGYIGDSQSIFSYDLSGTCYNNDSIFILDINKDDLEDVLKGVVSLNVKNNETNIITNIYIYLNSELSINDIYGSSLLV